MATKILGTKLEYNDLQFLLGLAKDAKQRRIVKALFGYQLKMIEQNGLYGIDNCKQFHNTWLGWISRGCNPDEISIRRNHHGYKARLQYAQRLYIAYVQEGDLKSAEKWRDTVTTVLRCYQVCGPSEDDMTKMWNDSIKDNITQTLDSNVEKAIFRGCSGIRTRYNEPCPAQVVYDCCKEIKSYFDMIEKVPRKQRKGFYKTLSLLIPNLDTDDYSLLIKKGPHKVEGKTIVSIFGQALDVHALNVPVIPASSLSAMEVGESREDYPDLQVFAQRPSGCNKENYTLLDAVNDLNVNLLCNYKYSQVRHKDALTKDIAYNPQIPVGTVPMSIDIAPGRTVLLQDKAGKTRAISIATYTVNNTLAPLHDALFKTLRRIRQDSTIQDKGIAHILEMTKKPDSFICSADLSSATDRLPVALQAYILYRVLKLSGQSEAINIANLWYILMCSTPFKDPCNEGTYFRYGAGQPMGVYTSWPMLSLTNHIMIRVAYYKARDKSLDYLVCGDDTVIGSEKPFLYYESWMNALGVTINRSKSHICRSEDPQKVAEFCKRLAVNGQIVSSVSPKVLIRASRDKAYQSGAISCIHEIIGPISNKKLASLVGRRIGDRRLYVPERYGGWGQISSEPFHQVLMKDNFIFLYIYKKMRASVTALETVVSKEVYSDQLSIDAFSEPLNSNIYAKAKKDWRLMGKSVYTPINLCRNYLYRYEKFITGELRLTPSQIVEVVKETFDDIDKCLIPLKISSKDDIDNKSKLAITYQRMFTRTMRNISSGKVHTFANDDVSQISIDIDYTDDPLFTTPQELVEALDTLMFT
jgi:hypothetical protein